MILRWLHDKKVADGSTLKPGKSLRLEAVGRGQGPEAFTVFKTYGPAYVAVRRMFGGSEREQQTQFLAREMGPEEYRSDREWLLPKPHGQISSRFVFEAEPTGEASGEVYCNRFGAVKFGIPVSLPDMEFEVGVEAQFAVDPMVILELLTGEELAKHILENTVKELSAENVFVSEFDPLYDRVKASLVAACTPPADWRFALDTESAEIEADRDTPFTLTLRVASPGTGAFAVWCGDAVHGGDDDKGTYSDVLAFNWENGELLTSPVPYMTQADS